MNDDRDRTPLPRREMLARLAGATLSLAGLAGFRWAPARASSAAGWDDRFELAVELTLAAQQGGRYHRPYVAVWVEDAAGRPVRTLGLWVNTGGRGSRYIRELRRWFSAGRQVEAGGGPDLVASVSSATRLPGRYTVTWNGRDDRGRPVEQGTYRVYVEAAREHGTYQLMQRELTLGAKPVSVDLPGNEEIEGARFEYRAKK
jgi:hypothetical protein